MNRNEKENWVGEKRYTVLGRHRRKCQTEKIETISGINNSMRARKIISLSNNKAVILNVMVKNNNKFACITLTACNPIDLNIPNKKPKGIEMKNFIATKPTTICAVSG